jgi:hypothetical protein
MFSKKEIKKLIENLLDETIDGVEYKKTLSRIENILNFLREKEIREEIERRWEKVEKQKSESFISDVHEYTENITSIEIVLITKTRRGVDISFTGKAGGLTEFGTELSYEVSGILPLDKRGRLKNIKWLKRGLIDTSSFDNNEILDE